MEKTEKFFLQDNASKFLKGNLDVLKARGYSAYLDFLKKICQNCPKGYEKTGCGVKFPCEFIVEYRVH